MIYCKRGFDSFKVSYEEQEPYKDLYRFPNRYGASVIRLHDKPHGLIHKTKLWELKVNVWENRDNSCGYITIMTEGVLVFSSETRLLEVIKQLSELPVFFGRLYEIEFEPVLTIMEHALLKGAEVKYYIRDTKPLAQLQALPQGSEVRLLTVSV